MQVKAQRDGLYMKNECRLKAACMYRQGMKSGIFKNRKSGEECMKNSRNDGTDSRRENFHKGKGYAGRREQRNPEKSRDRYGMTAGIDGESAGGMPEREDDAELLSGQLEGRHAVLEAYRAGRPIDRLYVQEGLGRGPVDTILKEAQRHATPVSRLTKERLDAMSVTGRHQGIIAKAAAFAYAQVEDMLALAEERGEKPFLVLLDGIEDPHNLGAIIRSACAAGAHGVIIPKHRACGLTPTAVRASAGAVHHVPVAKVTNISAEIEKLREHGLWIFCADMDGEPMDRVSMTGAVALVIGAEGKGVSRLVREKCDGAVSIPMRSTLNSLNASVAAGVLMFEVLRQKTAAGE